MLGKNYLIADDLIHQSYRWVLATLDGTVVGFASFINDHTDSTITDVAVSPDYQGDGIATRLIAQCVFEISTLWVDTIECNAWMTNNYPHLEKPLLRNGFKPTGIEPRVPADYRDDFECPVCGTGCECDTKVFKRGAGATDILNFNK
jgi:ribosomal protein S18 acetylase RimI-like enzyme